MPDDGDPDEDSVDPADASLASNGSAPSRGTPVPEPPSELPDSAADPTRAGALEAHAVVAIAVPTAPRANRTERAARGKCTWFSGNRCISDNRSPQNGHACSEHLTCLVHAGQGVR